MAHDVRNPHIFVDGPGNTASGDQVMDNLDAVWTAVDRAFTSYTNVAWGGASGAGTALAAAFFPMTGGPTTNSNSPFASLGAAGTAGWAFYLDPADYAVTGRTVKYNLRFECKTNSVAPAISLTCGLYPVATWGGGSGIAPTIATVGTVVAGSTATFTTPGATSAPVASSGDFTPPTAGYVVFGFTATGVGAANSQLTISAHLRRRWV